MSDHVCLIPARKGSKRLPGKNTLDFHGHPLGAWTLEFAARCGRFSRIVLSTDDEALQALATPPVEILARPDSLAGDSNTLLEVIRHVVADLPLADDDVVVLTPVTNPLRTVGDLDDALAMFERHGRQRTVFTTCANPHPPHLLWTMDEDGTLRDVVDRKALGTRKQAFASTYFWNDCFLIDTAANFASEGRDLYGRAPLGVPAPRERSVPIDHAFDLWLAAQLFDPSSFPKATRQE